MSDEIFEKLRQAVVEYDAEGAARWARLAVEAGADPIQALAVLTDAIRLIGDQFGCGELWLPDLVGAAEAMAAASGIIEAEIKRVGARQESRGVVVIGTVLGDIHDIGKNMVAALLKAAGYQVYDLGINIRAKKFAEAIVQHNADVLAMSALLTTTAPEQKRTIELLREERLRERVKVIVGGGGITQDFAESIGADGYDPTAPGAVLLVERLLGR